MKACSTPQTPDGRKKACYYAPQEEWSAALMFNLKRKAHAFGRAADVDEGLKKAWVRSYKAQRGDQKIFNFERTVMRSWTGLYEVEFSGPYSRLAYDAGFEANNAQGSGMVGVLDNRKGGKGA